MTAIETNRLTKQYGDVTAVDALDLIVDEGIVFDFLGPNGAGKSTVINCFLDYLRPPHGQISVLGHDAQAESLAVRQRTGVLPEDFDVYDQLTGHQHLQFFIDSHEASDNPETIAERVGIDDAIDRRAGRDSKGMAQRLILGTALVGQPDLLIRDEPSTGLDPEGGRQMREIVRPEVDEPTALGSAYAAGLAVGYWDDRDELRDNWRGDREFPAGDDADVDKRYERWTEAVERSRTGAQEE